MRANDLFKFIKKRHDIYVLREANLPKPWTKDPILKAFRFCNVYRELDTQTIWFARNWRRNDQDLWFASLVFRLVNWSDTTELIGYPVPWNRVRFLKAITSQEAQNKKVYNSAYMISTHGKAEKKSTYLADALSRIWANRAYIRYREDEDLSVFHARLIEQYDVGSFLAAQVIADCKYTGMMSSASDWWTFCAPGPGSKRGLNRVVGRAIKEPWKEDEWRAVMATLYQKINLRLQRSHMRMMHAQDVQNCLCEFDKYERVRLGEGRPRQRYNGEAE